MYAVIKTGGKQQRVQAGDVIEVEKIVHDGETVTFHPILVVDDEGKTHVGAEAAKAVVTAKPLGEKKGDKVKIFKYRPKTGYARRGGHRQLRTLLEIEGVKMGTTRARKPTSEEEKPAPRSAKATTAKATTSKATTSKAAAKTAAKTEAAEAEVTDAAE